MLIPRFRRSLVLSAALLLPLTMAASPVTPAANDVARSYDLIESSAYLPVSGQRLLDGARAALIAEAAKTGKRVAVPPLHATTEDANIAAIESTIAQISDETHQSATQLAYSAASGMAKAVDDRWTVFFTPEEYRKFSDELDPQKIAGIGVLIQPEAVQGYISAWYVVPGTPADQAGLRSGDVITSVDGRSTKGFSAQDATKILRGTPGSPVTLTFGAPSAPVRTVTIDRAEVQPPTVIERMLPDHVGYVQIFAFGKDTPKEFDQALTRLEDRGVRGFVLDLRNNGGGYVESALLISERFINDDPLLTIEERGDKDTTIDAGDNAVPRVPVAILVNGYTASASEITAGALQDDGIAELVGERTFGKGVMQTLVKMEDGSAIKITTAHYLTPKNRDINLKGIEPNYVVSEPKTALFGDLARDPQLQTALSVVTKRIAFAH